VSKLEVGLNLEGKGSLLIQACDRLLSFAASTMVHQTALSFALNAHIVFAAGCGHRCSVAVLFLERKLERQADSRNGAPLVVVGLPLQVFGLTR
jgi:hypothetical protein